MEYYVSRARVARPAVRALEEAVQVKKSLLKATKAGFFPSFFLGGFYGYGYAPGRQDVQNPFLLDDFNFHSGGVALGFEQNLSLHLTNARYRKAQAEYRKIMADRDQALLGIEMEIRQAYSKAVAKRESVKSAEKGFKAGRSWVWASTLNFGMGLMPVKDLLEAFVAYSAVKMAFLETVNKYNIALADLSHAVGEEIRPGK